MPLDRVSDAIQAIHDGQLVIVADDEDRENEGDLVCAAERITPDLINFMTKVGRGLICVAMPPERADALGLPLMTENNTDPHGTAFTISVDADRRFGVTTGISAQRSLQDGPRSWPTPNLVPRTCVDPAISSRSVPGPVESCVASDKRRLR